MKALGFVESPSPRDETANGGAPERRPADVSLAEVEEEGHDVVLLVGSDDGEHQAAVRSDDGDGEPIAPAHPQRAHGAGHARQASRAAMRELFADTPSPVAFAAPAPKDAPVPAPAPPRATAGKFGKFGKPRVALRAPAEADVEVELVSKEAVARTKRRFSRKWVREQQGKRWTERDFSEIIAQLRRLR